MKRNILLTALLLMLAQVAQAQPLISYITPDRAAPGMTVAVEFIAPYDHAGTYGADGQYDPEVIVRLANTADHRNVTLGPSVVSWNGRMIQQMILVHPDAAITDVSLQVVVGSSTSASIPFSIVAPTHIGAVTGGGAIGQGNLAALRPRNTMIVDSMILQNGTYTITQLDPDALTAGNQGYLPLRILSTGPIRLIGATIDASGKNASTGSKAGDGGPGGGGGGSGYPGSGGDGFTGGGGEGESNNRGATHGGVGTGSVNGNNYYDGGRSLNGLPGGLGMEHTGNSFDEGAGGGTGHPFGSSGASGVYNTSSQPGGYGAGSGGGSVTTSSNYGGGGGGNYTAGTQGQGNGNNGGQIHGNAMLLPFAGGSGGGSGNTTHFASGAGGSGGGGGGAIEFTSFTNFALPNGTITVAGGRGSNGNSGLFESGAGGGGGSAGAIQISARDSISIGAPGFSPGFAVSGGGGGSGTASNSDGGTGGVGRVRFNGYVSRVNGNPGSSNYFTIGRDYAGPSIQKVAFTKTNFTVTGYAAAWDGSPSTAATITVYYFTNSFPAWQKTTATTATSNTSHTSSWTTNPIAIPTGVNDSVIYVVALQPNTQVSTTFVDVPAFTMSHTSGIIAKVPGLPKVLVTNNAIDFGKVRVGKCGNDTTVKVYSIGKADLVIDSMRIVGPDAAQFTIRSTSPITIKPADSTSVTLAFCPNVYQCPMNATLRVFTNDISQDISLLGCAIEPKFAASVPVLDFGAVRVGTCKDSTFTVSDTGTDALTITAQSIGNSSITSVTALPLTIKPGQSATLQLHFCPTDTTTVNTQDSISSDAFTSPNAVRLTGRGKKGILALPATLDFGSVRQGTCRDSSFYAVNIGSDTITLSSLQIADAKFKLLTPTFPVSIAEHDSMRITIEYCSIDSGNSSTTAVITTPNENSKSILLRAFTGRGVLQLPATIDFGGVEIGSCRDTMIAVTNVGTDTLTATDINRIVPPFTLVSPRPIKLAPASSVLVDFRYCPTDTVYTTTTGPLDITGPGTSGIFTLTGHGIRGALTTSGPVDFGCVIVGSTLHRTIVLTNTGTAALTNVRTASSGSNDFALLHTPRSSIPVNGVDSVIIELTTAVSGVQTTTLTFSYGTAGSVNVPVTAHISPAPAITVLDPTYNFGTVEVGDSSAPQCFRITNYSCQAIAASSIAIASSLKGSFEIVSQSIPSALADSAIGTVCVRFIPRRNGAETGTLLVIAGTDTTRATQFTGLGHSPNLGVQLSLDSVTGRPGQVVNVAVRANNDITSAGITSVTFRVVFDPMQLDLRAPQAGSSISAGATYSVKRYSIGDQEITVTSPSPFTGKPVIAALPFEILIPKSNLAPVQLVNATFGAAPAVLAASSNGLVTIQECDSTEHIGLSAAALKVSQNSPNPFNPSTSITLDIAQAGHVRISVYNMMGEYVMSAFDQDLRPGTQQLILDGHQLASGVYRYVTEWTGVGNPVRDEKTMILVK